MFAGVSIAGNGNVRECFNLGCFASVSISICRHREVRESRQFQMRLCRSISSKNAQIETHPRRSLCPHIDELCRMLRLTWLTRHAWPRYAQLRAPCPSARQRRAGRSWRPGPVPRLRVVCLDVIGVAPGPLGRLCLGWVCLGCPCRESGAERSSLRREPGINLNP